MSIPPSPGRSQVDFVSGDFEALASHMRHCARAHGRWFSMQSYMQRARALAAGRIVTLSCVVVVVAAGIALFAIA